MALPFPNDGRMPRPGPQVVVLDSKPRYFGCTFTLPDSSDKKSGWKHASQAIWKHKSQDEMSAAARKKISWGKDITDNIKMEDMPASAQARIEKWLEAERERDREERHHLWSVASVKKQSKRTYDVIIKRKLRESVKESHRRESFGRSPLGRSHSLDDLRNPPHGMHDNAGFPGDGLPFEAGMGDPMGRPPMMGPGGQGPLMDPFVHDQRHGHVGGFGPMPGNPGPDPRGPPHGLPGGPIPMGPLRGPIDDLFPGQPLPPHAPLPPLGRGMDNQMRGGQHGPIPIPPLAPIHGMPPPEHMHNDHHGHYPAQQPRKLSKGDKHGRPQIVQLDGHSSDDDEVLFTDDGLSRGTPMTASSLGEEVPSRRKSHARGSKHKSSFDSGRYKVHTRRQSGNYRRGSDLEDQGYVVIGRPQRRRRDSFQSTGTKYLMTGALDDAALVPVDRPDYLQSRQQELRRTEVKARERQIEKLAEDLHELKIRGRDREIEDLRREKERHMDALHDASLRRRHMESDLSAAALERDYHYSHASPDRLRRSGLDDERRGFRSDRYRYDSDRYSDHRDAYAGSPLPGREFDRDVFGSRGGRYW